MRSLQALGLVLAAAVGCADGGGSRLATADAAPDDDAPLRLLRTAPLPAVKGRMDHLAHDAARGRVFVAALGNGSVEVVSLAKFERERSIGGLDEPQGVAFVPGADTLAVACGGDGTLRTWRGADLAAGAVVKLGSDADNVRWNEATRRLVVAFGSGGLASIDLAHPEAKPAVVPLDVHPEGFQVEASGARAFVNLAGRAEVAVCDLAAGKVTARWPLGGAKSNYPMALDEKAKRLYVGCRAPASLVVLSTDDGRVVASRETAGDPDDVFLDAARKRVLVICGDGEVDVFDLADDGPALRAKVPTAKGARTGLLAGDRLWVAAPRARRADPAREFVRRSERSLVAAAAVIVAAALRLHVVRVRAAALRVHPVVAVVMTARLDHVDLALLDHDRTPLDRTRALRLRPPAPRTPGRRERERDDRHGDQDLAEHGVLPMRAGLRARLSQGTTSAPRRMRTSRRNST